jgi:hypothetical protein
MKASLTASGGEGNDPIVMTAARTLFLSKLLE